MKKDILKFIASSVIICAAARNACAVPTVTWNEASPPGSALMSTMDDRVRELKTQLREVIDVDHEFVTNASSTGYHNQATLLTRVADVSAVSGAGVVYSSGTAADLHYMDAAANEIKLTTAGYINSAALKPIENNVLTQDVIYSTNIVTGQVRDTDIAADVILSSHIVNATIQSDDLAQGILLSTHMAATTKVHATYASQTITGADYVKIAFDTEVFDALGEFDTTGNTFTAQRTGYYLVYATAVSPNASLISNIAVYKNDAIIGDPGLVYTSASYTLNFGVTKLLALNAGDTLAVYINHPGSASSYAYTLINLLITRLF